MKPITITAALALLLLAPSSATSKNYDSTHYSFGPELLHRTYRSPPTAALEGSDLAFTPTSTGDSDPVQIARRFVSEMLTPSDYYVHSSYTDDHNDVTHVYFKQVVNEMEVSNADINVNIDAAGRIISWGDSFYKGSMAAKNAEMKNHKYEDQNAGIAFAKKIETVIETASEVLSDKLNQIVFGDEPEKDRFGSRFYRRGASYSKRGGCGHTERPSVIDYIFDDADAPLISPLDALRALASLIAPSTTADIRGVDYATSVPIRTFAPEVSPALLNIENVTFALSPIPVRAKFIQTDSGKLVFVWDLQVEMSDNWFHAHVDAHNGRVLSLIDWVSDAAYNVYPLGLNDPSDGPHQLLVNPNDEIASPLGWHAYPSGPVLNFTTTMGNNVFAHENTDGQDNWQNNYRPDGGKKLIFDFPMDPETMEPNEYLDGAIVNLFYWNNIIHDLFYRYGFTEAAGNFQEHNFGPHGKGGDSVIANAQDGSGYNNANFATPPDGNHGKMRMYVWDATSPKRDGDLEAGIIVHEYAHGISTRLTGGPANSDCLMWGEAGGMGEGWGDFFATIFRMRANMTRTQDFGMGNWANGGQGIRRYRYSTDMQTNKDTYGTLNRLEAREPHYAGAVWAEMLYEVYWNLVDKKGFTPQWFPPSVSEYNTTEPETTDDDAETETDKNKKRKNKKNHDLKHILRYGNTLALQLVVDGMKLQPCRPSFLNARDAILQADEILTGGDNWCEIWKGFAKRGLGVDAKSFLLFKKESIKLPSDCY